MKNAGWLFYRQYYHWLEKPGNERFLQHASDTGKLSKDKDPLFVQESRALTDFSFESSSVEFFPPGRQHIELETTYPGLLTGSGYSHQTGTMGEFKLGFFFDHTTGLPLIPGSSVKGILRSAFPNKGRKDPKTDLKYRFIQSLLGRIRPELAHLNPHELEALLFEGKVGDDDQYLPMHKHDVFMDAFITATRNEGQRLLDEDFLTPHESSLKNPVPVRFLKVLPGVRFRFSFDLKQHKIGDLAIGPEDKIQLFRHILLQFGAGAKTNVGYGQFTEVN